MFYCTYKNTAKAKKKDKRLLLTKLYPYTQFAILIAHRRGSYTMTLHKQQNS